MKVNEVITQRIIDALQKGEIPWHKPWTALNAMSVEGHVYRGVNRLLLSWANYRDPRYITFNKCRELGGNIKRGEKGWPIVFWSTIDIKDDDEKNRKVPFLRYYHVFNVEQCENLTLKPLPVETIKFTPIERCEQIIEQYVPRPAIKEQGLEACYIPSMDEIHIPARETFHSVEGYYSTLFHEIIHSTGHETRLNRDIKNVFGSHDYSKEELVAEIGAAFLRNECHIDSDDQQKNSIAYIQNWIKQFNSDPNMIIRAASQAQKAYDYILGIKYESNSNEENEQIAA